jgi:enoyl-CoA hydratase
LKRLEEEMDLKYVLYETEKFKEGSVAKITINTPETLNAMNVEVTEDILKALTMAEDDDDVKVIIFKGAGRAFTTGYDLSRVYYVYGGGTGRVEEKKRRPSQRSRLKYDRWRSETLRRIYASPKVTIAQVHGYCIGGGLYMVLCCDLAVAANNAKIGHSEQRLVFAGAMYVLPIEIMLIGQKKTRELLLTGTLIDGVEAERIGLVNKSAPEEKLEEETMKLAKTITLMPRDGLSIGKNIAMVAYDSLGLGASFNQGLLGHTMATNIRFEEDEFNFLKMRRDIGLKDAIKARDKRYEEL